MNIPAEIWKAFKSYGEFSIKKIACGYRAAVGPIAKTSTTAQGSVDALAAEIETPRNIQPEIHRHD